MRNTIIYYFFWAEIDEIYHETPPNFLLFLQVIFYIVNVQIL